MNWNLWCKSFAMQSKENSVNCTISLLFTSFCVLFCCCCCAAATALEDVGGVDDEGHTVFILLGEDEDGDPPEPTPEFNECWYIIESPKKHTKEKKWITFLTKQQKKKWRQQKNNLRWEKINKCFFCVYLFIEKIKHLQISWLINLTIKANNQLQCYFFLYIFYLWNICLDSKKTNQCIDFFLDNTKVSICTKN